MGAAELAEAVHLDAYIDSMMRIEDSNHDIDVESPHSSGGLDAFVGYLFF
jgi:hypothetical protein